MNRLSSFSWVLVLLLLTACGEAVTPTPLPTEGISAGEAAVQLIQQDMYLRLTEQYVENQRIETGAKMTATQQVVSMTATQERYQIQAAETQRAERATQAAWEVTVAAAQAADKATQQAAGTATQQAMIQLQETQEAHGTATQMAVLGLTATVEAKSTEQSWKQTQEAPMIAAKATAMMAEAEKVQLELEKARATSWVSAWGGWIFALIVTAVAVFVVWKRSQIGVITDENGKVRMVMINQRALNPALMSSPVLDFSSKLQVTSPQFESEETRRQIVHETKIVEAVEALPPGYQRPGLGLVAGMGTQTSAPAVNIQVMQPDRLTPVLDEVEGGLLEE